MIRILHKNGNKIRKASPLNILYAIDRYTFVHEGCFVFRSKGVFVLPGQVCKQKCICCTLSEEEFLQVKEYWHIIY